MLEGTLEWLTEVYKSGFTLVVARDLPVWDFMARMSVESEVEQMTIADAQVAELDEPGDGEILQFVKHGDWSFCLQAFGAYGLGKLPFASRGSELLAVSELATGLSQLVHARDGVTMFTADLAQPLGAAGTDPLDISSRLASYMDPSGSWVETRDALRFLSEAFGVVLPRRVADIPIASVRV